MLFEINLKIFHLYSKALFIWLIIRLKVKRIYSTYIYAISLYLSNPSSWIYNNSYMQIWYKQFIAFLGTIVIDTAIASPGISAVVICFWGQKKLLLKLYVYFYSSKSFKKFQLIKWENTKFSHYLQTLLQSAWKLFLLFTEGKPKKRLCLTRWYR